MRRLAAGAALSLTLLPAPSLGQEEGKLPPAPTPPEARETRSEPLSETDLSRLLRELGDEEYEKRERASELILQNYTPELDSMLGDKKRLEALGADLRDPEVVQRLRFIRERDGAVLLLDRRFSEECRKKVPSLARDIILGDNPVEDIDDLLHCSREDVDAALEGMQKSVRGGSKPIVEMTALTLLSRLKRENDAERLLPFIAELMSSQQPLTRQVAVHILSDFHGRASAYAPQVEQVARVDPHPDVRMEAIHTLSWIGEPARSAEVFVALLEDQDPDIRIVALESLSYIKAVDRAAILRRLAEEDPSPRVRHYARTRLGRFGLLKK